MLVQPRKLKRIVAVQYKEDNIEYFKLIIGDNGYFYDEDNYSAYLVSVANENEECKISPDEWVLFGDGGGLQVLTDKTFRAQYVYMDGTDIT